MTDIMLSFTDFLHFKDLVLESKKNNLFVGKALVDDDLFSFDNLKKMIENKDEWTLTNQNKELKHY